MFAWSRGNSTASAFTISRMLPLIAGATRTGAKISSFGSAFLHAVSGKASDTQQKARQARWVSRVGSVAQVARVGRVGWVFMVAASRSAFAAAPARLDRAP